jgi:BlaI family transcriptional regulator, penicillinase repressor
MKLGPLVNPPPLPKSELEVARIVWNLRGATVREVHETLPKERALDFWTVQTYLRRLVAKGYLAAQRKGRTNVYRPAVQPRSVIRGMIDDFIERVFDGETLPLFQHLIRERGLTKNELNRLQETLDELKKRNHATRT